MKARTTETIQTILIASAIAAVVSLFVMVTYLRSQQFTAVLEKNIIDRATGRG